MLVAQEQLTDQQQKTREAKIERLKRDLAAAQQAEAKANAAADASADALGKARRDLAAARESADKIADAQRQQVALERNVEEARARGDELQRKLAKKWRPIDPVEDDVHVNNTGQDPRLWGILYTGAGIIILFSALMWLTSAAGNAPPIAERATYDVLSEGQATGASGTSAGDDDERPLTV